MRSYTTYSAGPLMVLGTIVLGISGCASSATQSRTTRAPAGPIQAATVNRDVVPAGTELAIRVNENVSAQSAGGSFDAEIAQDIVNQYGTVLVPKGSPARLVVADVSGGGLVGTKTMELTLQSVTVNGRVRSVETLSIEERGREGIGANRRTAGAVGGGAALGALLGAVIGGGKGAAIGAAVGAAGGATAQVLTRGSEVRVPAETVLTFRLNQPIQLV